MAVGVSDGRLVVPPGTLLFQKLLFLGIHTIAIKAATHALGAFISLVPPVGGDRLGELDRHVDEKDEGNGACNRRQALEGGLHDELAADLDWPHFGLHDLVLNHGYEGVL